MTLFQRHTGTWVSLKVQVVCRLRLRLRVDSPVDEYDGTRARLTDITGRSERDATRGHARSVDDGGRKDGAARVVRDVVLGVDAFHTHAVQLPHLYKEQSLIVNTYIAFL